MQNKMKDSKPNDKQKKNFFKNVYEVFKKLPLITKVLTIISAVLVLFSFIAPALFIGEPWFGLDFTETGQIGDTIGGIMNPFISIAAVIVTFLAFYIQYQANETQKQALREQNEDFKNQIRQQEIDSQKTKFEKQFYEMLRLHKENLNDIVITQQLKQRSKRNDSIYEDTIIEKEIKGRQALSYLLFELEICLETAFNQLLNHSEIKEVVNKGYSVFFFGYESEKPDHRLSSKKMNDEANFFNKINELQDNYKIPFHTSIKELLLRENIRFQRSIELKYKLFKGYSSILAHYYRHLFHMVKFVVNQERETLTYEDKRNYLRILRSQMSNEEQVLLFFNWYSGFGKQWENLSNKFFTDYRMIHNINRSLLSNRIEMDNVFDLNYVRKEEGREIDHLFEFEDWN